jgi:replicative DNA helicase
MNNKAVITGIKNLDHSLRGGLYPGQRYVIAGRPGMGKSTFMMQLLINACLETNGCGVVFSLEMSGEVYRRRLLEISPLSKELLENERLIIDDTIAITLEEIERKCRKIKSERELKLVVIDYFYLLGREPGIEFDDFCKMALPRLGRLAKELEVPILMDIQLMKSCEYRADHHPILADIRWPSFLRHTEYIFMLHRESYYEPEYEGDNRLEIVVSELPYTDFFTRTIDAGRAFSKD